MSHGEILRMRARVYGRIGRWALVPALLGLAAVLAWWMPGPGANTAFSGVQIDWHMQWWWNDTVAHIFPNAAQDATVARYRIGWLGMLAGGFAALVMLLRKKPVLAALLFALVFVDNAVVDGVTDRTGKVTVEPAAVPAERLAAIADDTAQATAAFDRIADPHVMWKDPLGNTSWDMRGFSPASVSSVLHYVLAQKAYLENDPAKTRRHLLAVDPAAIPPDTINIYRLNVMREWLAARGYPAAGKDFVRDGYDPSPRWKRRLAWTGLGMAGLALAVAGLAGLLALILSRRAARLDTLSEMIGARA